MKRTDQILVALAGRRHPGCENLSLGYLRGALEAAGFSTLILPLNSLSDVRLAAGRILESDARLAGLSIPDTHSAILALALGRLLAEREFSGHITCGGPFATLARHWLLERYAWLDSVVRFAGEVSLTALVRALETGAPITEVPGLTTRSVDTRCAPADASIFSAWPHRDAPTERLGYNVASMLASKGCPGQCAYCGPAALQRLEREEAKRLGLGEAEMIHRGIGDVKRRNIDDLCDEMHTLWQEQNVRHFAFADEHLLPFDEAEALEYLRSLDRGLKQRSMTGIAMGCQLHAGRVTPRIAGELAKIGFTRILLGLDIDESARGAGFGRIPFGSREADIVRALNRRGVATISNIMLLHPYATVDSIAAGIDAMAGIEHGIVEAGRMFVYEGTRLKERLATEGRLFGNPLRWEYASSDPAVQRFTALFGALKLQAFGNLSIGLRAHESMWDVALARRIHPERDLSAQARKLTALSQTIRSTYVEAYRRGLSLSLREAPESDIRALVRELAERTAFLSKTLADIDESITATLPACANPSTTYKVLSATLFSFCLASSAVTGCRHTASQEVAATSSDSTAPTLIETDSDADSAMDTDNDMKEDTESPPDTDSVACDTEMKAAEEALVRTTVSSADPCFNGRLGILGNGEPYAEPGVPYGNTLFMMEGPGIEAMAERAEDTIGALDLRCGSLSTSISYGGLQRQAEDLVDQIRPGCGYSEHYIVSVDENGYVVDIVPPDGEETEDAETVKCILAVLDGLAFPCLADISLSYFFLMII